MTGDVFYTGEFAFWCFVTLVLVGNAMLWWVLLPMWKREAYDQGRADERAYSEWQRQAGDMGQFDQEG